MTGLVRDHIRPGSKRAEDIYTSVNEPGSESGDEGRGSLRREEGRSGHHRATVDVGTTERPEIQIVDGAGDPEE